jgi:hypothetical protein
MWESIAEWVQLAWLVILSSQLKGMKQPKKNIFHNLGTKAIFIQSGEMMVSVKPGEGVDLDLLELKRKGSIWRRVLTSGSD